MVLNGQVVYVARMRWQLNVEMHAQHRRPYRKLKRVVAEVMNKSYSSVLHGKKTEIIAAEMLDRPNV